MAFTDGAYTHELTDTVYFTTTPASEAAARAQFQEMFNDILGIVNGLMTELEKQTATSGAENIGSKAIATEGGTISAGSVYAQLAALKAIVDNVTAGTLYEGAISQSNYFAAKVVDNTALADDIKVGSLAGLTTTAKTSVQAAINELVTKTGSLASLTTTEKTSLVLAINELVTNRPLVAGEVLLANLGADVPIIIPIADEMSTPSAEDYAEGSLCWWN